ncbi:MAG: hypothetical protein CMJ20_04790 [Phycisphaeraceae bacterium]|nr:hypothetical protein [Phycisphaeraceae bacterium]
MRHCKKILVMGAALLFSGANLFAGAPSAILDDNEPGINAPMLGDPADDTTWNFGVVDWGQVGHRQGGGSIVASAFSAGGLQVDHESNPTIRYSPSMKGDNENRAAMDTSKDWVLSFDFAQSGNGMTTQVQGADKLFELGAASGGDVVVMQASDAANAKMQLRQAGGGTLDIDGDYSSGSIAIHYKASNSRMDVYFNDALVAPDQESVNGNYDVNFMQIFGGGHSYEIAMVDNLVLGIIPEPATGLLLVAGGMAMLRRRR